MAITFGVKATGSIEITAGNAVRKFPNVVLDDGWHRLASKSGLSEGSMVPKWLRFGIGTTEPSESDAGLEERIDSTTKQATSVTYGGLIDATRQSAYSEALVRFDYAAGEITGEWTELGLSYDEDYAEPYNRALVRDENWFPAPLLVLSDQPVTVFVRLRIHFDQDWGREIDLSDKIEGLTGTVNIDNNVATENNAWKKGLPIHFASLGGTEGLREHIDLAVPEAQFFFQSFPYSNWSASRITFMARSSTSFIHIDFSPSLVKPYLEQMVARIRVSISR